MSIVYNEESPAHRDPSFLTQPPAKPQPSSPPIVDEDLDLLKRLSKNAADEYFETIFDLNKPPKTNKSPPGLKSHLFRSEQTFFNNDTKIQEMRRGRFIGKLLHGVSYNSSLENYQQIITDKIKKISVSNLLPEDMARRMAKTIEKKIKKLEIYARRLEMENERDTIFQVFNDPDQKKTKFSERMAIVRKEIIELSTLLNFLKKAVFFNTKSEEAENTPQVSLGNDTDLIYDKLPKPKHENFHFLKEEHIRDYINDLNKEKYCINKLQKITRLLENLPQMVFFRLNTEKSDILLSELSNLEPSSAFLYPTTAEQTLERCKNVVSGLTLNFDFNFDNPTMLFYNIDNFFQDTYQKQVFFLEWSEYVLRDERLQELQKNPHVFQDPDQLLDVRKSVIKIKKTFWVEDLRFCAEIDKFQRQQRIVFEDFFNVRLYNWLKYLTLNNLEQVQLRISRLVRDIRENLPQQREVEDVYFEFLSAYYKLTVVKSRNSIGKILSYLNFFRMVQKDLVNEQNRENEEKNKDNEKVEERKKKEEMEKRFVEKSLFKLFEKQNKFDKYVLSSPIRTHDGLANIHQDFEKFKKDLFKLDEETIASAMKSEEPTDAFFRSLRDKFTITPDEFILIEDFNHENIIYDAVIHDFFDITEEMIKIASFYLHLTEKERKNRYAKVIFKEERNPLDREELLQQDEETLFNEILDLERRFHFEKAQITMLLLEILDNCYVEQERLKLQRIIVELSAKRPIFDLTKNTILESYQLEINNLVAKRDLIKEMIEHQQKLERDTLKLSIRLKDIGEKKTDNQHNIGEHQENSDNESFNDFNFFLNTQTKDPKKDIYSAVSEEGFSHELLFFFDKLVKFLTSLSEAESQLTRFSDSNDSTDTVNRLTLFGLFYQQVSFFWSKLMYNFGIFEELTDFMFLENDVVLDMPLGYEIFKREFFKQYYERADKPNRENLNRRDNSQRVIRIANNKVEIQRSEFLELMFNYIEFQRLRGLINIHLFQIAFLMELYRDQMRFFYENPFYMFQAIGVNSVIDDFNLLKHFISLDKLKCSSEIIDLQNWVFYMITPKRMIEPALLLNSLLSLEVLASIGVVLNNLYSEEIVKEFPAEKELRKKLSGSGKLFFYNIFEKKKRQIYLATTLNLVVTKSLDRIRQKLKYKKDLKDKLTLMNKLDMTEKKPKRDLGILEMFCTILQKELAFDLMKIQTILIRKQLLAFDRRLPFPKRIFEVSPLYSHDYIENPEKDQELDIRVLMKKKNNSAFFDEFGYALNIFVVPSIEEILKIVQLDFDSNQVIEYEEIFYDEDEYRLEEQFLEIKEDSRIPLKKLIEKQRKVPLRKVQRLYQRKKQFVNKGFEYLEKTSLFIMMNVLYSLYNVFLFEYFMNVLESHPQDIFYLKMGFLESESLVIDNNGKIPELKKNELRIRNDLDGIKFLSRKITENIQLIKNNSKIINVNEAIMIYLQKIQRKKFNLILMLLLNETTIVRKAKDFDFLKILNTFLQNFAFKKVQFLSKYLGDFKLASFNTNNKTNPYIFPMFEDISPIMKLTKSLFFEYKLNKPRRLGFFSAFDEVNKVGDLLELGFVELSKSKRTQLATHLSEILTKTNEIINKKGFYELQNLFRFEKEFNHVIKLNIRYNILKEAVIMYRKKVLPFQIYTEQEDSIEQIMEITESNHGMSFNQDKNQINEEKFGIILNEDRLRFRMEVLANEFEKVLLEENIKFYREFNKVAKQDLAVLKPHFNEFHTQKSRVLNASLLCLQSFLQNLLANSSELPSMNKGPALAISSKDFERAIDGLNDNLRGLVEKRVNELWNVYSNLIDQATRSRKSNVLDNLNLRFETGRLRNQVAYKVEAKVSYKSYMLLYQLDYLTRLFMVLKDEASLKEEQVKEALTNNYGKDLSDYEITFQNYKSDYMIYKNKVNAVMRDYIDTSKEENLKKLKKKVYELKEGLELLNLTKTESDSQLFRIQPKKITILYLFEVLKRFRTFHQVKDVLTKEKSEKDLLRLNERIISNETFMHKIRDLEMKEKGLNDELAENIKKINYLKKQNLILSKDLAASYNDKKKLVKENSFQSEKINECFTTLEEYKKKKTIERSPDRSRVSRARDDDDELTKKQESLRRKFEAENIEIINDKIIENDGKKEIENKRSSSGKKQKKDLKVNIAELPQVIRRKK